MLAAFCQTKEDNSTSSAFKLLGTATPKHEGGLISNNTSLISATLSNGGMDYCSFYSGPSDAAIIAFGESAESCGSIAYSGSESCGSIAFSGGSESCGSVASSFSGGGSFSGSCCSYSC
jgi:hypothetical protein